MDFIKKWDIYGKPVTFYYNTSTVHKTYFGAFLSILSFTLMMTIAITSLYNFLYQKPAISSNIVYFINKKFAQLDAMAIKGKLSMDQTEKTDQIDNFVKYFRIVLHEKYFDEVETFKVAKIVKVDKDYEFNVTMSISDVFKEKEFSSLKIMSCSEIKKMQEVVWADYLNETTCDINYEKYLSKDYKSNSYLLSFDAPNYTIDRKGRLRKVPHQNELIFDVIRNKTISYVMETKYVVIEDDTNIYYTHKKYDAYYTMKRPIKSGQKDINNGYRLEISMQNNNNDQLVLISLYKYKLLDFLAKLGGIMKIITFMKMTGKFWSSFFYEQTLYNLIVKRDNPYLKQKRRLIEALVYKNPNKMNKSDTPASGESFKMMNNLTTDVNVPISAPGVKNKKEFSYASYCSWFLNRFCKGFFVDDDAMKKREMLAGTLGLNNYLMHLDYVDRQILIEQHTCDINEKIEEIINKNNIDKDNNLENSAIDNTGTDLQKDIKQNEISLIDQENENNLDKPLAEQG
jgi:hypothetical protein